MNNVEHAFDKWKERAAGQVLHKLAKHGIGGSYVASAREARQKVLAMVPKGASIARGGSMTLEDSGIWQALTARGDLTVFDPFGPGVDRQQSLVIRRQAMTTDFYLASVNAFTLDGKLVNLDGTGSRVACISFGPNKVILVAGMNKLAPDLESAMARVKHVAAPANCIRIGLKTPCAETGLCSDCASPSRICHQWSILEGHGVKDRIHLILVAEPLGY